MINDYSEIPRHITTGQEIREVNPEGSQNALNNLQQIANDRNIVLNAAKTTLIGINPSTEFKLKPYLINPTGGNTISESETLKIVGFNFSQKPTVWAQIDYLVRRARKRIWILQNLKKASVPQRDIVSIYHTIRT